MAGNGLRSKRVLGGLTLVLLLGGAGVVWRERSALLAWYYVRGLTRATDGERVRWAERVAGLGEDAAPGLLDALQDPSFLVCRNAAAGLDRLSGAWGPDDARTADLALQASRAFARLSPAGQQMVLDLSARWFADRATAAAGGLVSSCARLVAEAAAVHEPDVQAAGLELADALLRQPNGAEALSASRELVRGAFRSAGADNRLRAVRLALRPGMDLLDQVVVLLSDPAAEVRRAAMLAVGPAEQVIDDEALLASLHDPDPEVRRLCEAALRGRRLLPEHIHLGRLLTDPNPVVRLKILDDLYKTPDLDPGIWLRRLSHDPSPAVRVAAVRAMTQQTQIDLSDRIDQMARSDPSPTVCQLAQFYLRSLKSSHEPAEKP
jgi:hypothetical protein